MKIPIESRKGINLNTLITGASGALGREISKLMAQHGNVILSGRNGPELEKTMELCQCQSRKAIVTICGDLSSTEIRLRIGSFASLDSIGCAVLCHGLYHSGEFQEPIVPIPRIIEFNLTTTIQITKRILPVLVKNKGILVAVNSIAGRQPSPFEAVYSAAKHGIDGFLKAVSEEVSDRVRILQVFLGGMQSKMTADRGNYTKLMKPIEVAETICDLITVRASSLWVTEVTLRHL